MHTTKAGKPINKKTEDTPHIVADAAKTKRMEDIFYGAMRIAKSEGVKKVENPASKGEIRIEHVEYNYNKWGLKISCGEFAINDSMHNIANCEFVDISYKGKVVFEALADVSSFSNSFGPGAVSTYVDTPKWQSRLALVQSTIKSGTKK